MKIGADRVVHSRLLKGVERRGPVSQMEGKGGGCLGQANVVW